MTGASGFVGGHTVTVLRAAGYDVIPLTVADQDLTKAWPDLGAADGIVHLAGLAAVGQSFLEPQRYIESSSSMLTNLGEALLARTAPGDARAQGPRVVVVSSGSVYGSNVSRLTEDSPLNLVSPYAVSKALIENQVHYYVNRGVDMIIARPFNHIGPGQAEGFIVPDLAARLRSLRPGEKLRTGNLDSSRDYTDVRDVVRAYQLLLELDAPQFSVYNVASGESRTGRELLEVLCDALGIAVPDFEMELQRKLDPDRIVADASRLRGETGWQPAIGFERSVRDYIAAPAAGSTVAPRASSPPERTVRRALVIGASGFLGTWITHRLVESGVVVTGWSRSRPHPAAVRALRPPTISREVNLSEGVPSNSLTEFDAVFFAAGSASVPHSLVHPLEDLEENGRNVVAILDELARLAEPPVFINVSSAAVYGDGDTGPLREADDPAPISPYGVSKLAAEQYVELFARTRGVPGLSVRPFSIFGEGQTKQVVYDLSLRLLRGERPLRILGDPSVSRDFIHVDDVARGIIHIARHAPGRGETYNLGSGRETSLAELAFEIASLVGAPDEVEFSGEVRQGDPRRWRGDVGRIRQLGFEPTVGLREGLRATLDWIAGALDAPPAG